MAVVTFDPTAFVAVFPEFTTVPPPRLERMFDQACLLLDNTDASPVLDVKEREVLLELIVAHLTTINGLNNPQSSAPVGRLSSATEGTVTANFDMGTAIGASQSASYWNQTRYGAQYWAMTTKYRRFMYIATPLGCHAQER